MPFSGIVTIVPQGFAVTAHSTLRVTAAHYALGMIPAVSLVPSMILHSLKKELVRFLTLSLLPMTSDTEVDASEAKLLHAFGL